MGFEVIDGGELVAETRLLTGSQAKTAFALRLNCAHLVETYGVNRCGFQTLTVGDFVCRTHGKQIPTGRRGKCPCCKKEMPFYQVFDMEEASRRLHNLLRRVLPAVFLLGVIVTERCQNGAIHFHVFGPLLHDWDIRTGLNFEQVKQRNYTSVCAELRGLWAELRRVLPKYGFGRAELLPIRKTGEALASYISKYIEKNVMNRPAADKGKKLVRYFGWEKRQLKPNEFEWNSKGGQTWRAKIGQLAKLGGLRVWDDSAHEVENPERKALYLLCWHLGGSQGDIANLKGEDVDWTAGTVSFTRKKTGVPVIVHLGTEALNVFKDLPGEGLLFPYLASVRANDRATEFRSRCRQLGISGVTLHSYRYAWAERAKIAGYPERFAQEALGHNSKAVHRAYAKRALMKIPSLEQYEREAAAKVEQPNLHC